MLCDIRSWAGEFKHPAEAGLHAARFLLTEAGVTMRLLLKGGPARWHPSREEVRSYANKQYMV